MMSNVGKMGWVAVVLGFFSAGAYGQCATQNFNSAFGQLVGCVTGANISRGQLLQLNSANAVVAIPHGSTGGVIGIASQNAASGANVNVVTSGAGGVLVDNACVIGQFVLISTTIDGDGHCSATANGQIVGEAEQTTASSGTVTTLIGPSVSQAVSNAGGATTMYTAPEVTSGQEFADFNQQAIYGYTKSTTGNTAVYVFTMSNNNLDGPLQLALAGGVPSAVYTHPNANVISDFYNLPLNATVPQSVTISGATGSAASLNGTWNLCYPTGTAGAVVTDANCVQPVSQQFTLLLAGGPAAGSGTWSATPTYGQVTITNRAACNIAALGYFSVCGDGAANAAPGTYVSQNGGGTFQLPGLQEIISTQDNVPYLVALPAYGFANQGSTYKTGCVDLFTEGGNEWGHYCYYNNSLEGKIDFDNENAISLMAAGDGVHDNHYGALIAAAGGRNSGYVTFNGLTNAGNNTVLHYFDVISNPVVGGIFPVTGRLRELAKEPIVWETAAQTGNYCLQPETAGCEAANSIPAGVRRYTLCEPDAGSAAPVAMQCNNATAAGAVTGTGGVNEAFNATATTPPFAQNQTGSGSGSYAVNYLPGNHYAAGSSFYFGEKLVKVGSVSAVRAVVGMYTQVANLVASGVINYGTYDGAFFRYDTGAGDGGAVWYAVTCNSVAVNCQVVATGASVTTNHTLEIVENVGPGSYVFKVDGVMVQTNTTVLPLTSASLQAVDVAVTLGAGAKTLTYGPLFVSAAQ